MLLNGSEKESVLQSAKPIIFTIISQLDAIFCPMGFGTLTSLKLNRNERISVTLVWQSPLNNPLFQIMFLIVYQDRW